MTNRGAPITSSSGNNTASGECPASSWAQVRRHGSPSEIPQEGEHLMNASASMHGQLVSQDGDARHRLIDWAGARASLEREGIALTPPLLSEAECQEVRGWFDDMARFRSTVVMQRYGFGLGTYRYLADPLPSPVHELREKLYPPLADIANAWAALLGERRFPATHRELAAECAAAGQSKPTPLILQYGPGGHANLHQDLYGDIVFPLQVAIMLSRPGEEFEGGESVFVEQRPRSQSRAIIARPAQGQGIVFPVRHRPVHGSRGYRRHAMRHGSADVTRGQRTVLGIIFHNAR